MNRRIRIESLQGDLIDAALAPAGWRNVLARIGDHFDACACDLYLLRGGETVFAVGAGPEIAFDEYVARFLDREPRTLTLQQLRTGEVVTDLQFVDRRTLRTSGYYGDFLPRHGLGGFIGGVAANGAAHRAYIGIHYPRGRWDIPEEKLALARRLQPMLARAVTLQFRLAGHAWDSDLREAALDRLTQGVVVLDEIGRIRLANAQARTALAARGVFRVRHGRMECVDPAQQARLLACLQSAQARRDAQGGALLVGHADVRYSVMVAPSPAESRDTDSGFVFVFITRLEEEFHPDVTAQLRELFGLSVTEAHLAAHLLRGGTLKAAAAAHGLTYESARFALKQVFGKTGVHTQTALVALLARAVHRLR